MPELEETRRLALDVKAEVAQVLHTLQTQDEKADQDRRTRTRRFVLGGVGVVLAVLLVAALVYWTDVTARQRAAENLQRQQDALCPLLAPLLDTPEPLTERQREYREQVRRSYGSLRCPPLPGEGSAPQDG